MILIKEKPSPNGAGGLAFCLFGQTERIAKTETTKSWHVEDGLTRFHSGCLFSVQHKMNINVGQCW